MPYKKCERQSLNNGSIGKVSNSYPGHSFHVYEIHPESLDPFGRSLPTNVYDPDDDGTAIDSLPETDTCVETVIQSDLDKTAIAMESVQKNYNEIACNEVNTLGDDHDTSIAPGTDVVKLSAIPIPAKRCRDSGFVGSNDDLLKNDDTHRVSSELGSELEYIREENKDFILKHQSQKPMQRPQDDDRTVTHNADDEQLFVSNLRQFVKILRASHGALENSESMGLGSDMCTELTRFENELMRLTKTIPGICEAEAKKIVETFCNENVCSDFEMPSEIDNLTESPCSRIELRKKVAENCQQIVNKLDRSFEIGASPKNDSVAKYVPFTREIDKQRGNAEQSLALFGGLLGFFGKKLVALMHEMNHIALIPPKPSIRYHRRQQSMRSEENGSMERDNAHDFSVSEATQRINRSIDSIRDLVDKESKSFERIPPPRKASVESVLLSESSTAGTKLSLLDRAGSLSVSAISPRQKPVSDLLASRSCGSIIDDNIDKESNINVSTLVKPRAWQHEPSDSSDDECRSYAIKHFTALPSSTKSLPRSVSNPLNPPNTKTPITSKATQTRVKSARYRPPGFDRPPTTQNVANSTVGTTTSQQDKQKSLSARRTQSTRIGKTIIQCRMFYQQ